MSSRDYNYLSFANSLLTFAQKLVIKNETIAEENEDTKSLKNASTFILAYEAADTFSSHSNWRMVELLEAGIGESFAQKIIDGLEQVPVNFRDKLLNIRRRYIIDEYVEYNNYYRMLAGLPNYGDRGVMTSFNKPVTELTEEELFQFMQGEIDELIKLHPDKEYLKYIGSNSIDFYTARKARNYDIIGYKKFILEEPQVAKFMELYYQSRNYVVVALYSKAYMHMYYYDSFMIMLIVFMSLQRYISEQYNYAIHKDFYNIEDIKNTFLSYGLPFFSDIPIKYQRNIVKNINKLLKYKGTDKVLVDVVELFGFSNVELYRYYLVKDFKRDLSGEPIIDVNDLNLTYDLKFAQIPFESTDITEALQNSSFYQTYEEVVAGDPFWGNPDDESENPDEDFRQELLNMEFNYVQTKYLSMNTMFDVSKNNLEISYFFNLIKSMQEKGNLAPMKFINKDIKPDGKEIRIFDAIVAVYYLLCKKFGVEDNILTTATSTASIYAFEFNKDKVDLLNKIEEAAKLKIGGNSYSFNVKDLENRDIEDMELIKKLYDRDELVEFYFKNANYRDYLIERMNNTEDYLEYKALNEIYKFNMLAENMNKTYQGYKTYSDYLKANDYELYNYIIDNSQNSTSINLSINNILYAIESYLNHYGFDDMFASFSPLSGDIIKTYITRMINIFKAYTVELKKVNVYYIFDEKFMNRIKMFTFIYKYANINMNQSLNMYMDVYKTIVDMRKEDIANVQDEFTLQILFNLYDQLQDNLLKKMKLDFNVDVVALDSVNTYMDYANYDSHKFEKTLYLTDNLMSKRIYLNIE